MLKVRRIGGHHVLSLFDEHHGTAALPQAWTDRAVPSPYATVLEEPPILHAACLLLTTLQSVYSPKGCLCLRDRATFDLPPTSDFWPLTSDLRLLTPF